LCGQTCLHKLVDEFMAKAIASRGHAAVADAPEVQEKVQALGVDASLTSDAAYIGVESSAKLITPKTPVTPTPAIKAQAELVTMPGRPHVEAFVPPVDEPPRFASRNWRAEAWEREREREKRVVEHRSDIAARRRSSA
jgi:hypothetical protein